MIERIPFEQSHMPFLVDGPHGTALFFSAKNRLGHWKAHFLDGSLPGPVRLRWNNGDRIGDECCPTGWWDGSKWNISFIGRSKDSGICQLYRASGGPGSRMTVEKMMAADFGFVSKDAVCSGRKSEVAIDDRRFEVQGRAVVAVTYLQETDRVVLSVSEAGAGVHAVAWNPGTNEAWDILCAGQPVYKPTILGGLMVHAIKRGENDYRLEETGDFQFVASSLSIQEAIPCLGR